MKTYFIKDDETKTAMDYLRGTDVIDYINGTSKFDIQNIISDVNGKSFKEVLTQLKQLHDDYITNISRAFFDYDGFETDLQNVLSAARRNGDTKIAEQIIKKTNQLKLISGFTELRNAVRTATAALTEYRDNINKTMRKFGKIGVNKIW